MTVKGIVTKMGDVRPCVTVASYTCDVCGFETYQVITGTEFNPLVECPAPLCKQNQTKGQLVIQIRTSRFIAL